jgi:hypothetical protein
VSSGRRRSTLLSPGEKVPYEGCDLIDMGFEQEVAAIE